MEGGLRETEKKVLECLKKAPASVSEISEKIGVSKSYVYETLYRLELKGLVRRKEWLGFWVWEVVK